MNWKATEAKWEKCDASDGACQCGLIWDVVNDVVAVHVVRRDDCHEKPDVVFQALKDFVVAAPATAAQRDRYRDALLAIRDLGLGAAEMVTAAANALGCPPTEPTR